MPLKDTAYPAPEDHLDTIKDQYGVLVSTIRRIKLQRISFKTLYSIHRMHIPNTPYSRSDQDSRRNKDIERGPYSKSPANTPYCLGEYGVLTSQTDNYIYSITRRFLREHNPNSEILTPRSRSLKP